MTLVERFLAKVELPPAEGGARFRGCWRWRAAADDNDHVRIRVDGRVRPAHQVAYELFVGPSPDSSLNLVPSHTCLHSWCASPYHVEWIARKVNCKRGDARTSANQPAAKVVCIKGHPFIEERTQCMNDCGHDCKICHRNRQALDERRHAPISAFGTQTAEQLALPGFGVSA